MATKLELTQLLATRNEELQAARLRISVLEGELALRPRAQSQSQAKPFVHTPYVPPQWQLDRMAALAAAKAEAMRTGRCVRVA